MAIPTVDQTEGIWIQRTSNQGKHYIQTLFSGDDRSDQAHRLNCRKLIRRGSLQPEYNDHLLPDFDLVSHHLGPDELHRTPGQPQLTQMQTGMNANSSNTVAGMSEGFDTISVYTLNNPPAGLHQLTVKLDSIFSIGTVSFSFSLPFHVVQNDIQPMSVTANGITITLKKVVVTSAGTIIDLMSPRLNAGSVAFITLLAGQQKIAGHAGISEATTLTVNGKTSPVTGVELNIQQDLTHDSGKWSITILPEAIHGATEPWVFTFVI